MPRARAAVKPVLLLAASLAAGAPAHADAARTGAVQPLEPIAEAARAHLEARHRDGGGGAVEIEIGRLDPRLRLAACAAPLETFLPAAGRDVGRVAVGVRCPTAGWKLYVTAAVRLMRPVVVLARALPRGSVLGADDLRIETRDVGRLARGYSSDPDALVGQQLARPTLGGRALGPRDVESPRLVHRGERVSVLARTGGIEIRSEGEALEDGAAGEVISVRNLRSRRVVDAVVAGAGAVEVRL